MADLISDTHMFKPITEKIRQVIITVVTQPAQDMPCTPRGPIHHRGGTMWPSFAAPTGHLVGTFVINAAGGSFKDSNVFNLVASDDEWAAPIMAEVGPRWTSVGDRLVQLHRAAQSRHRKVFKPAKAMPTNPICATRRMAASIALSMMMHQLKPPSRLSCAKDDPKSLVAALKHTNRLWRRHAQRLLVERGQTDVVAGADRISQRTSQSMKLA